MITTMRRFAILNMKGGVGKTTVAVNLAAGLGAHGCRTLLIDTDPQGNVGHSLQVDGEFTVGDLMLGHASLESVIVPEVRENLDVIPATTECFGLEQQLSATMQRETILSRALDSDAITATYDAIVLDTSPSMNLLTFNALLFADRAIIPVSMNLMAVIGARETLSGIEEVQRLWPERGLEVAAILPTFVDPRTRATRATQDALDQDPSIRRYLAQGIRQCLDLTYAAAKHTTIWEYAPRSRAAEDFSTLLNAIETDNNVQLKVAANA